ncbi:MAG TPA: dienelactone hydrolase family protein [Gemmatimonadetes bacterium]|nr:dienelactone hydrolase family protein [Gemmatimonadota bacterium]
MLEATHQIETSDGTMGCFSVHPEEGRAYPAVILYMDAPGIREELREFCRRIAGQGYYVLLPNMYYRPGTTPFDYVELMDPTTGAATMKKMFAAMGSLTNELVMRDSRAMLDFLATQSAVTSGAKGCIGYCMSGQYVVSAAGTFPEDIAAAASLYGVSIVTDQPDSPHLLADRIRGELYLGFAETDEYVPDNVVPDLVAALDANGVAHRTETFPTTHHGFCFPERGPAYSEKAAETVWDRVFDLFRRRLA